MFYKDNVLTHPLRIRDYSYNLNGTIGFLDNYRVISDTLTPTSYNGYCVSPLIPIINDVILEIRTTTATWCKAYYVNEDKTVLSSASITLTNGCASFRMKKGCFLLISFNVNSDNVELSYSDPQQKNRVDRDIFYAFWENVHYPYGDFSYSEIPNYVNTNLGYVLSDDMRGSGYCYIDIPYDGSDSYTIKLFGKSVTTPLYSRTINFYTPMLAINNLQFGKTYIVQVTGKSTTTQTFTTDGEIRIITLDSVNNARDVGGRVSSFGGKTKQGLVYRCATMDNATDQTKQDLENLGIVAEIDVRGTTEVPSGYVSKCAEYYNIPCGDASTIARGSADTGMMNVVRKIIELLEQDKPVIFHCVAGADRTGDVSFCLQGILGVSASDLQKEYETTAFWQTSMPARADLGDSHYFSEAMLAVNEEEGDTYKEKWENIFKRAGATDEEIDKIRTLMLTDYNGDGVTIPKFTGITVEYTGGDAVVGTLPSALTGVVVTASYDDDTTEVVNNYEISTTAIAEGTNTITVTYRLKKATFTVNGVTA